VGKKEKEKKKVLLQKVTAFHPAQFKSQRPAGVPLTAVGISASKGLDLCASHKRFWVLASS